MGKLEKQIMRSQQRTIEVQQAYINGLLTLTEYNVDIDFDRTHINAAMMGAVATARARPGQMSKKLVEPYIVEMGRFLEQIDRKIAKHMQFQRDYFGDNDPIPPVDMNPAYNLREAFKLWDSGEDRDGKRFFEFVENPEILELVQTLPKPGRKPGMSLENRFIVRAVRMYNGTHTPVWKAGKQLILDLRIKEKHGRLSPLQEKTLKGLKNRYRLIEGEVTIPKKRSFGRYLSNLAGREN